MEWIIVAAVVVVLLIVVIGIYNRLVALRQNVNQGVADIDAQLRQRHDLVPNLVNTVKGYATHERETLDAVVEARNRAAHGFRLVTSRLPKPRFSVTLMTSRRSSSSRSRAKVGTTTSDPNS